MGKTLGPFLKTIGNRRWRKTAKIEIDTSLFIENNIELKQRKISRKAKKNIKVRIKLKVFGDETKTYQYKFKTIKSANDCIRRNKVITATFIN